MRGIFVTLLTAILLLAQNQQSPASSDSKAPPKFSVTTQLVIIGVNAKDKDGKPIADLQVADFVVTEDGKKQKLASCEYQHIDNSPLEVLPATAAAHTNKPRVRAVVATSRPAEIRYKDRRLLVFYFDMTAMPLEDQLPDSPEHLGRT
jgi:hypothetical protein